MGNAGGTGPVPHHSFSTSVSPPSLTTCHYPLTMPTSREGFEYTRHLFKEVLPSMTAGCHADVWMPPKDKVKGGRVPVGESSTDSLSTPPTPRASIWRTMPWDLSRIEPLYFADTRHRIPWRRFHDRRLAARLHRPHRVPPRAGVRRRLPRVPDVPSVRLLPVLSAT